MQAIAFAVTTQQAQPMATRASTRTRPNILITGTPGTGKSSLAQQLVSSCGLTRIDTGALVKEKGLHSGYDAEFDTYTLDEDKVMKFKREIAFMLFKQLCDTLEPMLAQGGVVLESHSCDFFPERWFDLVACLRTDNSILYDRLTVRCYSFHRLFDEFRGYSQKKLSENMECEIMQVCLDEAMDSYKSEIVETSLQCLY